MLDQIMDRFDIRPNLIKQGFAVVAERIAGLKPNGHLRGYSPLSRVVELESLICGVHAKQRLWASLRVAGTDIDATVLDEMIDRAEQQLQHLEDFHGAAASQVFATPTLEE